MNTKSKVLIGKMTNDTPVFERYHSHVHTEYDGIYQLIAQILPHIESTEEFIEYSHDFGFVVGKSICVETTADDDIVFAKRPKRQGLTRFVKNRAARPTSFLTVVLKRDQYTENEEYLLITAYVGEKAPPEPWDKSANSFSKEFWSTHALVWGSVEVIAETETKKSPW